MSPIIFFGVKSQYGFNEFDNFVEHFFLAFLRLLHGYHQPQYFIFIFQKKHLVNLLLINF